MGVAQLSGVTHEDIADDDARRRATAMALEHGGLRPRAGDDDDALVGGGIRVDDDRLARAQPVRDVHERAVLPEGGCKRRILAEAQWPLVRTERLADERGMGFHRLAQGRDYDAVVARVL